MTSFALLICLAWQGEPAGGSIAATATDQPPFHEIQRRLSDLLKRESQAKAMPARSSAIRALCELHWQIVRDGRYSTSDVSKEYRAKDWSRLTKIKTELKQQLAREAHGKEALQDSASLE